MKTFTKNNVSTGELELYKVLNKLAPKYNKTFKILILPEALGIDEENQTLTLTHYHGETFNAKWDESNGGLPLGLDLSKEVPQMLKDLSTIDTSQIAANKILSKLHRTTFDYHESLDHYAKLAMKFCSARLISDKEYLKVKDILIFKQSSRLIFNNGDFYPRNLIREAGGRIVLIDWEVWNPHSPFYVLDHPENVAAVMYVHLWGNPVWQKAYMAELKKYFAFSNASFSKAVVMKSLELANLWFRDNEKNNELVAHQIRTLQKMLQYT